MAGGGGPFARVVRRDHRRGLASRPPGGEVLSSAKIPLPQFQVMTSFMAPVRYASSLAGRCQKNTRPLLSRYVPGKC